MTESPTDRPRKPGDAPLAVLVRERPFWLLGLLGVVFFHRPLLTSDVFYLRDIFYFYVSQQALFAKLLRAGEWPLWDPYHHGGVPFLADISNTVLYPWNLAALVFSPFEAITWGIVVHVLAAAAAAYLLARRLGLEPVAGFVAGTVFAYAGYTLGQGNVPGLLMSVPYLPLMVLFWHRALAAGNRRAFLLAAACGLLQVLAGAPTTNVFTFVTLLAWGLFCVPSTLSRAWRVGLWTLLGVTVGALAAVQVVPLLEMTLGSTRGSGLPVEHFVTWSLRPLRLPELVIPGFLGKDTLDPADFWGVGLVDNALPYVMSLYFGAVVLGLALLGASSSRSPLPRPVRVTMLALAGCGVAFALGRFLPFFTLLYAVPGMSIVRYPIKLMVLAVLPVALLAGAGTTVIGGVPRRRLLAASGAVVAVFLGLFLVFSAGGAVAAGLERFFFGRAGEAIDAGLASAVLHPLAIAAVALLLFALPRVPGGARGRAWGLALLVAVDLMVAGAGVNPLAPEEVVAARPAAADVVAETLTAGRRTPGRLYRGPTPWGPLEGAPSNDALWRHVWLQEVLANYQGAKLGLPVVFHHDYDGLAPARMVDFNFALERLPPERRLPLLSTAAVSAVLTPERIEAPGLELVTAIKNASPTPFYLYRLTRAMERAEVVTAWRVAPSAEEAFRAMLFPDFDPRRHAVVEEEVPAAPRPGCGEEARVVVEELGVHRARYAVVTPCPALVVFSEPFSPGWRVRVDGAKDRLRRVNYAWSGVFVEAGEHVVERWYRPASVLWGAVISLVAALACVVVWFRPGPGP